MRRAAWLLVASGMALAALAPAALGETASSYADKFDSASYSGSNGTLAWGGPWSEVGESDDPGSGAVRVAAGTGCKSGNCLQVTSALLELQNAGAARFADTSVFSSAELSFEMVSQTLGLGGLVGALTGASFSVEVTTDSGSRWTVLDQGSLLDLLDTRTTKVLSLDSYLAAGFGVRFLAQDLLGGRVMIDDVQIDGVLRLSPTTTVAPTTTPTVLDPPVSVPTTVPGSPVSVPTTVPGSGTPTSPPPIVRPTTTTEPALEEVPSSSTTSTTVVAEPPPGGGSPSGPTDGLRVSASGVQASAGLPTFHPIGLAADQRSAVERIASGWINLVALAMVVTGFSIFGVDRRRRRESGPDAELS